MAEPTTAPTLPILPESRDAVLSASRSRAFSLKQVGAIAERDPALAIMLVHRANSDPDAGTDAATSPGQGATHAALLLGVERVLELVRRFPDVSKLPTARRDGYCFVLSKAYHASALVRAWVAGRRDVTVEDASIAAMACFLSELTGWLNRGAPESDDVAARGRYDPRQWFLGPLAEQCQAPNAPLDPRRAPIALAVRLADAAATGWQSDEALRCFERASDLEGSDAESASRNVYRLTAEAARPFAAPSAFLAARALVLPPGDHFEAPHRAAPAEPAPQVQPEASATARDDDPRRTPPARPGVEPKERPRTARKPTRRTGPAAPSAPESGVMNLENCRRSITALSNGTASVHSAMQQVLVGMHEEIGFERAAFAMLTRDRARLTTRFAVGDGTAAELKALEIVVDEPNLFQRLLRRPQAVWLNGETREKIWPLVPETVRERVSAANFCAMSVFVRKKPIGIFFCDDSAGRIDEERYREFKRLCHETSLALDRVAA